jgi:hypothetical protein
MTPREEPIVSVLPFGTTEEAFHEFATTQGYTKRRRTPEDRATLTLLTVTYGCGEPGTFVQYVFNSKVHVASARSHGPDRLAIERAMNLHFVLVDETEIRTRLESTDAGDRGLAMAYLAEFAPRHVEPGVLDLFARGSTDPDADVREFSALAMGVVGWLEFRPIVQAALEAEKLATLKAQFERLRANLG